MDKVVDIKDAISKINSGNSVMIGGFGGFGMPGNLVSALADSGVNDLTIISEGFSASFRPHLKGVLPLLEKKLVSKAILSFAGGDPILTQAVDNGELELEYVPQGTMAESIRAAGAGIGGYYTPTGVGTIIAEGKEKRIIDGKEYILEKPISADFALVKAYKADKYGNAVYKFTGENFNTVMAMAADTVILEAEEIVETGSIAPDEIKLPGIFVDYVVQAKELEV